MPYIQHLPKMEGVDKVVVVVPEVNLGERDALGWDANRWLKTEGIRFVVAPSIEEVEEIFKNENDNDNDNQNENVNENENVDVHVNVHVNQTWCLFSGINAFPAVAEWFRMSLKYNVRRGVITEPPYVYDHPLWQHAIRFALKDWRYVKYIDKIFVMGEDYLNYYRFWSKRWEVIPFMYCTEENNVLCKQSEQARANETLTLRKATGRRTKFGNDTALRNVACGYYENQNQNQKENGNGNGNENENQKENGDGNGNVNQNENENQNQNQRERVRVVYVGSLSHRKNVGCLLKAAKLLSKEEQEQLEIGIVGDGDEREALERLADGLVTPVRFYGTQPMEMIPDIMGQYDVLVLPSLHDGWGAVVNEALTLGLYVICSDHCGAKYLLKDPKNGATFVSDDASDFMFKLRDCIKQKNEVRAEKRERIQWSKIHISGEAVASYFLSKLTKTEKTGALRA